MVVGLASSEGTRNNLGGRIEERDKIKIAAKNLVLEVIATMDSAEDAKVGSRWLIVAID